MSKIVYVDSSCCHQKNKFSWAVVGKNIREGGSVTKEGINSGYCELYAVYQALQHVGNTDAIIFCDNAFVVRILNKSKKQFEYLLKSNNYRPDKDFLRTVYDLYQDLGNVSVRKINRKANKKADKLARSFKNW